MITNSQWIVGIHHIGLIELNLKQSGEFAVALTPRLAVTLMRARQSASAP